jgi:hypothetical protein
MNNAWALSLNHIEDIMQHTTMTLPTVLQNGDVVPVVAGSNHVTKETDRMYIAYGAITTGNNTKYTRNALAYLYEYDTGKFVVCATSDNMKVVDPTNKGFSVQDLGKTFPVWRVTGTKPDPEDGGKTIPMTDEAIVFDSGAIPVTDPSALSPWNLPDGKVVTEAYPSLHVTFAGMEMDKIIEADNPTQIEVG